MRIDRALRVLPVTLTIGVAVATATIATRKLFPAHLAEHRARQLLAGAAAFVVLSIVIAMVRRLAPRAGTLALDASHRLDGRLGNALAFAALAENDRTPLMEAAIDDACAHAGDLRPRRAARIRVPPELAVPIGLGAGLAALALVEIRTLRVIPPPKTIDALTMNPDDLELFKDAAKELAKQEQSPEVKAAVDRFNQLIEDIANRRLDRTEAFRKMEAIERELLKGQEADKKALEDALDETAKDLERSDLAKPVGQSLEKHDLEQAKKELKDLAKKLRENKKPDKAALEKLRKALEEAAKRRKEALAALDEKRSELEEELLKRKHQQRDPDAGAPEPQEQSLLKKKERELERLDREAEQQRRVARQLDRLDRELAKAAEDLMRDLGLSAQDLEQAAEDMNRMQEEQMSEKEKEELRQRLEELRELLRQQGQGGKQRMARMLRFGKRARGGQGQGQQGQGQDGQDQPGQDGQDGQEGQDGQQGQNGQNGQNGKGHGGQGGQQWVLGPGGKKILIPGMGQGQGQGDGPQGGQGSQGNGGQGTDPGGHGIGSGHDGDVKGAATNPKMGTEDVQAQGLDTQQGPSNSEVILSAAEKGFRGGAYKKVYTDYHTQAEQQVNKDDIPDGYRFYVRRYFQLIRPRD